MNTFHLEKPHLFLFNCSAIKALTPPPTGLNSSLNFAVEKKVQSYFFLNVRAFKQNFFAASLYKRTCLTSILSSKKYLFCSGGNFVRDKMS